MSELFGNHIVGFPTRRLIYLDQVIPGTATFVLYGEKKICISCKHV